MADWRKLAKAFLLADGRIDEKEVGLLRRELFADGRIDKSELEFILDVKRSATSCVRLFHQLVQDAVVSVILADGAIGPEEVKWLRKNFFAGGKADDDGKKLLQTLKAKANNASPDFGKLCEEMGTG
jgi:hypothetical protein